MATMRSSLGNSSMSALSKVVLPEPVPPETRMFLAGHQGQLRRFQDVLRQGFLLD